jgi:CheY-like chemotaxis protein
MKITISPLSKTVKAMFRKKRIKKMVKVLIAENDLLTADLLDETLVSGGYEVCGIARNVEEGVALAKLHEPDLLLLDLRLDGGLGSEIVARLAGGRRTGILYATGNAGEANLTRRDGDACLKKPYSPQDVIRALKMVEQIVSLEKSNQNYPSGFQLLPSGDPTDALKGQHKIEPTKAEVEHLLRQQAALATFGSFALGENDLNKVLTEAARICAESLSVPFCKVCRYRVERNDLLVEAGVGWKPGVIGCVVSRADETSPQGRAFLTQEPVICSDLAADNTFILPAFYAEHGIISTLDVIIKKKDGAPWGILEIDNPKRHLYKDRDINF